MGGINMKTNGELVEQVDWLLYLGSQVAANGAGLGYEKYTCRDGK